MTLSDFVQRSKIAHGNKYDYSKSLYINTKTKIEIQCEIHGAFLQIPSDHMRGIGCFKCGVLSRASKRECLKSKTIPHGSVAIPLTRGQFCLVDTDDYAGLKDHLWMATGTSSSGYYANTKIGKGKSRKSKAMARIIMGVVDDKSVYVDHINGNTLDNRKCNLRVCSPLQNGTNKAAMRGKQSRHKGVYKNNGRWRAVISSQQNGINKKTHIGYFDSEIEAAKAYNENARILHGDFARLNDV